MLPKETVQLLDRHIVGQSEAKKAIAIALRNRWRVQQISSKISKEILPKNILMIGGTGVGKTELARRAARLAGVPFLKIEATKFTELGYVGRDVESIIQDLMDMGIREVKEKLTEDPYYQKKAENVLIDIINNTHSPSVPKEIILEKLNIGELDDLVIESPYRPQAEPIKESSNKITIQEQPPHPERMKVRDARKMFPRMEVENISKEKLHNIARMRVQNCSIVFIDEIDKICSTSRNSRGVNTEGVQRDLLPIIEGTIVSTKQGDVDTSRILFICAGAFHLCKPSDMLSELQGRLPIKVELEPLTENDFYRILTEPQYNLIRQHSALLAQEGIQLIFPDETIREIARIAFTLNRTIQNIGARRLFTVMEKLLEEISYSCGKRVHTDKSNDDCFALDKSDQSKVVIYPELVHKRLGDLMKQVDLSRFIL
jgi:ATP-dependent HslUV protease ATP-binding subunit HslU